jgi:stress-induced morphogen
MTISIRGQKDDAIDQVAGALASYQHQHPDAQIEVYRQNSVSVRVRIVDRDFSKVGRADRHEIIWRFLEELPEEVQSQVSLLLALTPDETQKSFANFEFDHPVPSSL